MRVNETIFQLQFEQGDSGGYEVKAIWNSAIYARESKGELPGLYYLVLWKSYPKEENTWEPGSIVQHLRKLINTFHKNHLDKATAISPLINSVPPIARLSKRIKALKTKQMRGQPAKDGRANKQIQKD